MLTNCRQYHFYQNLYDICWCHKFVLFRSWWAIPKGKFDFAKKKNGWLNPFMTEVLKLICSVNQWTGFYMIGPFVMKELMQLRLIKITIFSHIQYGRLRLKLSTFIITNVKNMRKSNNKQKQPPEVFCKKMCS